MTINQQSYKRFKVTWRAKVAIPKQGLIDGIVTGASVTRGYLEFPSAMPIDSIILMEIYPILNRQIHIVRLKAKVIHDTVLSGNRGHGLGLKITQISDHDRDILRKAIVGSDSK